MKKGDGKREIGKIMIVTEEGKVAAAANWFASRKEIDRICLLSHYSVDEGPMPAAATPAAEKVAGGPLRLWSDGIDRKLRRSSKNRKIWDVNFVEECARYTLTPLKVRLQYLFKYISLDFKWNPLPGFRVLSPLFCKMPYRAPHYYYYNDVIDFRINPKLFLRKKGKKIIIIIIKIIIRPKEKKMAKKWLEEVEHFQPK